MFYYISFLRPPPTRATFTDILITPQITNDLRTEYLDDPIDIYYSWSNSHTTTKPTKLTSWRTSTAYKEISVPRPPHLDSQASWQLLLSCGTTPTDQVILLGRTDTTGNTPFAVSSMPVTFSKRHGAGHKHAAKGTKQERIARSYGLCVPARERPIVFDIKEQTSFDLDKKIWDSGIGLGSWLVHLFSEETPQLSELRASLFGTDARHILELGAGTGIVAITLAILRSTLDLADPPGSIVTTDLASAMPILQDNITSHHALMAKCVPQTAVLDWEQNAFPRQVQAQLEAGLDVIVMADVTYNTASFSALIRTLSQLCKHTRNGRRPRVLMGHKERHSDERTLWDRTRDIGLYFQQIARVDGAGGHPVEIWLG